jgi:hypothetical protein
MRAREYIIVTGKSAALARSSEPAAQPFAYRRVIDDICALNWDGLTRDDLVGIAWAYYYFSVQFRENLEIACKLFPADAKLRQLEKEECHTDNLSPWPPIAVEGEKLDHDEFMRRLLELETVDDGARRRIEEIGRSYLERIRKLSPITRATSIASYEDSGLERVFRAILRSRDWDGPLLQAFRHFLLEHIRFDTDSEKGHGALSRHLTPSDQILPLWAEFHHILVESVPRLAS